MTPLIRASERWRGRPSALSTERRVGMHAKAPPFGTGTSKLELQLGLGH